MSVIEHDFGLQQRELERRFRRQLSLDALHEANIRTNPLPYLDRASEHIFRLERALFEASQAAAPSDGEPSSTETMVISKTEYQRLVSCRSIIEKALAELVSDQDES
jgi:hypothetical protein